MLDLFQLQSSIGNNMAITGYPMVDNFILITILPMLIGYCMTVFNLCKELLCDLLAEGFHLFQRFLDRKLKGEVLVDYTLDSNENKMFSIVKPIIFADNVKSDVNDQLDKFLHLTRVNNSYVNYFTKHKAADSTKYEYDPYHYSRRKKLRVNYDSSESVIEQTDYMDFEVREVKMFKHNEYYLRFELSSAIVSNEKPQQPTFNCPRIGIKIISFSVEYDEKKDYSHILEDFLNTRFKLNEQMHYTYHILVNDEEVIDKVREQIRNYSNNSRLTYIKSKDGKSCDLDSLFGREKRLGSKSLILSEPDFLSEADQKLPDSGVLNPNLKMSMRNKGDLNNLSKQKMVDFMENLNFNDQGLGIKNDIADISNKFLTKKQYDLFWASLPDGQNRNYFVIDNCIFLIKAGCYTLDLFVISIGTILKKEKLTELLYTWFSSKVESSQKAIKKKNNRVIYKRTAKAWASYSLDIRSFDTIYLPRKTIQEITDALNNFKTIKSLYEIYQIPYKKGILFYGPPGTGKTSVVKAIAYEFQMNIFIINVNDEEINDDTISDVINSIGTSTENRILLFEDIDTAFADKEKIKIEIKDEPATNLKANTTNPFTNTNATNTNATATNDTAATAATATPSLPGTGTEGVNSLGSVDTQTKKKFLTYSGLLNALDGVMSNQHGVITVMTTNYIDRLGAAFLRPGRIDHKFELTYCIREQIEDMLRSFINKKIDLDRKLQANQASDNTSNGSNSNDSSGISSINGSSSCISNGISSGSSNGVSSSSYMSDDLLDEKINEFCESIIDPNTGYTYKKLKPCEIQGYLLKYIENIDNIFKNVHELNE
jgi:ATP-dependent 26S proteasome regulatory subunit